MVVQGYRGTVVAAVLGRAFRFPVSPRSIHSFKDPVCLCSGFPRRGRILGATPAAKFHVYSAPIWTPRPAFPDAAPRERKRKKKPTPILLPKCAAPCEAGDKGRTQTAANSMLRGGFRHGHIIRGPDPPPADFSSIEHAPRKAAGSCRLVIPVPGVSLLSFSLLPAALGSLCRACSV